jgi:hypothetical protein
MLFWFLLMILWLHVLLGKVCHMMTGSGSIPEFRGTYMYEKKSGMSWVFGWFYSLLRGLVSSFPLHKNPLVSLSVVHACVSRIANVHELEILAQSIWQFFLNIFYGNKSTSTDENHRSIFL